MLRKILKVTTVTALVSVSCNSALAQSRDQELFMYAKQPENEFRAFLARSNENLFMRDMKTGETVAHFAAECTKPATGTSISYLAREGIDFNIQDIYGQSPMHQAASSGCYTAISELKSMGLDVNLADVYGRTPLHLWSSYGDYGGSYTLQELIKAGANLNAKDKIQGLTPLHEAVQKADDKKVKYLLDAGADPNVADNQGVTPLSYLISPEIQTSLKKKKRKITKRATKIEGLLSSVTSHEGTAWQQKSRPTVPSEVNTKISSNRESLKTAPVKKKIAKAQQSPSTYECPNTEFENLTSDESVAMEYAVTQDLKNKGVDFGKQCIAKVVAVSKVPFRGNKLVKYDVRLFFPFGYRADCLKLDKNAANNLSKEWNWDTYEKITAGGCNAFSAATSGAPIEVGGYRKFSGETEI